MNINGINSNNVINLYSKNKNRVSQTKKVNNVSDRIEISKLGKSLTNYTLEGVNVDNSKKIQELKNQINNGTYNVDAKLTARSILDTIKENGLND
ncbi:MAG: flagellar biosynthesis anti-sigma factor FlgM [Clostridium sp.]|uniref:Negative regulator of flagellin synthesis n=1 Tax=Clostridium paraputrificum TaxID=29363 RepID=A0A6N3GXD0_9CLOT|nr:flagellar biosynthesis anti-sigma factor FlgM [Clostridium sp.]MBS5926275.1 flagellar biosynthesis anti-sigma factor FlgM [Clostridium sp.]